MALGMLILLPLLFSLIGTASARFNGLHLSWPARSPPWDPTYQMNQSTIVMPCNDSGFLDPAFSAKFGIIDYDWSNAKQMWCNQKPMDCEERLVTQAIMTKHAACPEACPLPGGCPSKDSCPHRHVWVYRNFVKALPWYKSVRDKIEDPAYAGWFLKFKDGAHGHYHVPSCTADKCSGFYHDQEQTPQHPHGDGSCVDQCDCGSTIPCGEYLFDHRNDSLRDWLVGEYTTGMTGVGNPNIDGFYIDDSWSSNGPSEEDSHCIEDMGLSPDDVTWITAGWTSNMEAVHQAVIEKKSFTWGLLGHGCGIGPPYAPDPKACINYFRKACLANSTEQTVSLLYGLTGGNLDHIDMDLASFLVARGKYAWLGYGWIGCSDQKNKYAWSDRWDLDYGEPTELCKEAQYGVFTRDWTKATATMDCNSMEGKVVTK